MSDRLNLCREHEDPAAVAFASDPKGVNALLVTDALLIDRQRVVHSAAFRRLQHKTQVFGAGESDHFRSRLTHTMEVAHWAMLLARGLGLSTALAEVVALAHDLGHPPFGHAGERALDACMLGAAESVVDTACLTGQSSAEATSTLPAIGFEHNAHTLRVVEYLEHPYPAFRGLNLTHVVRECLAKHSTRYDRPGAHPLRDGSPPPLESEVVDLADRLAYGLHDLQDGLYAGLIEPASLGDLSLWRECYAGTTTRDYADWRAHLRPTIDAIQQRLLGGVLDASALSLASEKMTTPAGDERVRLDAAGEAAFNTLEEFLLQTLYRHSEIQGMDQRGRDAITSLFERYTQNPVLLPKRFRERVNEQGAARVATDYIAGMTDRYCLEQAERLGTPL